MKMKLCTAELSMKISGVPGVKFPFTCIETFLHEHFVFMHEHIRLPYMKMKQNKVKIRKRKAYVGTSL